MTLVGGDNNQVLNQISRLNEMCSTCKLAYKHVQSTWNR